MAPRVVGLVVTVCALVGWIGIAIFRADVLADMGHRFLPLYVVMYFGTGVVLSAVVAGVVFLVSRRSNKAACWAYCIVLVFGVLGQKRSVDRFVEARDRNRRALAGVTHAAEPMLRGLASNELTGDAESVGRVADAFERASSESRGEASIVMGVLARFFREQQPLLAEQEQRAKEFVAIDWSAAQDKSELDRAQEALDELESATRAMATAQTEAIGGIDARLAEARIPEHARRQYLRSMTASNHLRVEIWRLQVELLKTFRVRLQLLRKHWGQWELNTETERYAFRDATAGAAFDAALFQFGGICAALEDAEQRLVEHLKIAAQALPRR